ncbi:hypothetical protein IC582_003463 [Cucumis melo]
MCKSSHPFTFFFNQPRSDWLCVVCRCCPLPLSLIGFVKIDVLVSVMGLCYGILIPIKC